MLKNISELKGAISLSKTEQKSVKGGDVPRPIETGPCGPLGGTINPTTNAVFCAQVGGVYLGGGKCMICH
ncbi:hypothetical protein U6A24_15785 [Aquimarina gracilis]|uniref:Natural product n=1 Tax=Aquimarina gracilis TaxID=874422 RepID=A0ABU5ZYP6_9FLAO|nr:hypothetical protein [Aquimarina gracilis]MEB3346935.1 hypothetical protein [Aquimarina gracilis]